MQILTEWISNIILFILFAIVIDLLLPSSSFQKYVKMIVGLLLIIIILTPVLDILSLDIDKMAEKIEFKTAENDMQIENLTESKKKEIQAGQRAYILEQMAVHLEKQAEEELIARYGLSIQEIQFSLDQERETEPITPESIKMIVVHLQHQEKRKREQSEDSQIQVVEPVSIDTTEPLQQNDAEKQLDQSELDEARETMSEIWQVPSETIQLSLERGK